MLALFYAVCENAVCEKSGLSRWDEVLDGGRGVESFLAELRTVPHNAGNSEAETALRCDLLLNRPATFPPAAGSAVAAPPSCRPRLHLRPSRAAPSYPLGLHGPLLFALKTAAVSRNNGDVLTGEVKIGRDTVKRFIRRTALLGWSNGWLRSYSDRLLREPSAG